MASLPHNWIYHVFPSFHGPDVRKSILSHTFKEFKSKGIDLFIDNEIERSKSIGAALIEAIRGSRIAIVLLSKNYASSTWCLNELVEIIKCREKFGQTVMVLFYEVDPTHVKKQTGDFEKVFRKTCKGKNKGGDPKMETCFDRSGSNCRETEAEMIQDVATNVSNKLNNSAPTSDFNGLVGMESQMTEIRPLLQLDSDEVRKIGIWGPPGIGKTTFSRSLFNRHSQDFQLSVFMDNIKTKYAIPTCSDDYNVKLELQKQFMSQLTNEAGVNISHLGVIKDRLKDKKVLVVLDDVDHLEQLEAMAKETYWFGPGSRIIITTQDQRVLKASGTSHIHRVMLPSYDEALQMFCMYAFDQEYPKDGFRMLACEVIDLVDSLPLGLRVMGSYLRGISEQDWTEALPRLRIHLDRDEEIASILKFSYNALHEEDKRLFLHIACFFNGEPYDTVECSLTKCFLDVTQGLRVLLEKSLISIKYESIKMAGLLVQLGRKIVREQFISEPGKRQFLNDAVDIGEVLNDDKAGNSSVIGIDLEWNKDITWTSERAFERLSNLQFIRILGRGVNSRSMNYISRKLRVLIWDEFEMTCFPSSFNPTFLVKLEMPFSKLEKLWEEIQPLSNLRYMNLSYSESLKELPDLSTATNLYHLDLRYCSSLVKLPSSIGSAINLQELNLSQCSRLVELPFSIGNEINLQKLNLSHCSRLVELPLSIGNAINLQKLNLSYCSSLVKLPYSIGNAINLQELNLSHCSRLAFSLGNAINLQNLFLGHCSSLVKLPSSIGNAVNLEVFVISNCSSLVEIPSSITTITNLKYIFLHECSSLMELPFSFGNIFNLTGLDLSYCSGLVELPASIGDLTDLKKLNLRHCSSLVELPFSIGNAVDLEELNLSYCSSLVGLPSSMRNLDRLSKLELKECLKLEVILANINLLSLRELNLSDCSLLKSCDESSTDIQELDPWRGRISSLQYLTIYGMRKLVTLPPLPDSILFLYAEDCESLERLDCSFSNPDLFIDFGKCFKLNQEARDLIIRTRTKQCAVFPAEEVPQCFTYRSSGSSLTVKLNQLRLGTSTKFKGCALFAGDDDELFTDSGDICVCCSIKSGGNDLTACYKDVGEVVPEHLYIFEVDVATEELTSTELVFKFELCICDFHVELEKIITWETRECGIIQLLEVPSDISDKPSDI